MAVLLLHICCGPCATSTVSHFQARGWNVEGFFFNPNVHPYLEFEKRLAAAKRLASLEGFPLHEDLEYDPVMWFRVAGVRGRDRCRACIALRLERAALEAGRRGADAFSTSLAISPYQDHQAIAEEGAAAGERQGLEFVYEDLRPLFPASRQRAKELDLYRQQYCGCILSEWERYR